jgi:hypothetical protein
MLYLIIVKNCLGNPYAKVSHSTFLKKGSIMARKNYENYGWKNIVAKDGDGSAKIVAGIIVILAVILMLAKASNFIS